MALREFLCIECEKKFAEGKWSNSDGHTHKIAHKTYHIPTEGLTVTYAPERRSSDGMNIQVIPARDLTFSRGTFVTDDPEKQNFLDKYPGCVTREIWEETHLPLKERQEKAKRELVANQDAVKSGNEELLKLRAELEEARVAKAALAEAK